MEGELVRYHNESQVRLPAEPLSTHVSLPPEFSGLESKCEVRQGSVLCNSCLFSLTYSAVTILNKSGASCSSPRLAQMKLWTPGHIYAILPCCPMLKSCTKRPREAITPAFRLAGCRRRFSPQHKRLKSKLLL